MILVNLLSSVAGPGWRPEKVELANLAPAALSDMEIFSKACLSSATGTRRSPSRVHCSECL